MRSALAATWVVATALIMCSRTHKLSMRGELGTPGLSPLASSSWAKLGGSGGSWVLYRGPCPAWGCGEVVGSSMGSSCKMRRRPGSRWEALGPLGAGEPGAACVVAWARAAVR